MSSPTTTDLPVGYFIPRPTEFKRAIGRGIDSTVGPEGCLIQYRGTETEKKLIKQAAAVLGITYGSFIRNVATDMAKAVLASVETISTSE